MKKHESAIQTQIQNWIELHGGVCQKTHGSAIAGSAWPDLIGGMGLPFAVEVKRPGQDATKAQEAMLRIYEANGFITGVVRSVSDFERLMRSANSVV